MHYFDENKIEQIQFWNFHGFVFSYGISKHITDYSIFLFFYNYFIFLINFYQFDNF